MTHHKGSQANTFHRDASRVIESHPQTGHKVAVIDEYYGQHPEILIAAAKTTRIDASHIWLIEVCAGAGTYLGGQSKPSSQGQLKTVQWSVGTFKTGQ
jgi:hypothetical protein